MMQQLMFFAPLQERFLAFLIDNVLMAVLGAMCAMLMQLTPEDIGLLVVVNFVVGGFYFAYFQSGKWQASPGMRVLGLRLVKLGKFRNLQPSDAILRYIAMMMPMLFFYTTLLSIEERATIVMWSAMVWYGVAVFRPDRATLHDLLSNMRVVRGKTGA